MIEVSSRGASVVFSVRVAPRASRNAIGGEYQGALKIRLTAPPMDNHANEALCRILANRLNLPRSAVRILSGFTSRTKRVEVTGVAPDQIQSLA
ncbi:MAG TPA: DUF167 domain-containing protein [Candidatus Acidoferrales bacterium]|nr:DUF167 domain-containing protein [Candidatus Acidoferrales bacterium]